MCQCGRTKLLFIIGSRANWHPLAPTRLASLTAHLRLCTGHSGWGPSSSSTRGEVALFPQRTTVFCHFGTGGTHELSFWQGSRTSSYGPLHSSTLTELPTCHTAKRWGITFVLPRIKKRRPQVEIRSFQHDR